MRIDVSEPPVLCGCDTCVQHRTLLSTQETEPPSNVTGSSLTPVPPVSSGPVQALGSTSDQSSGTETPPLAPPPPVTTTSVNPEPPQSINFPPAVTPVSSEPTQALAPTASGSMQGPAFGFGTFAAHRPFLLGASSATSQVNGSSPITFAPLISSAPVQALGTATTAASSTSSPVHTSSSPTTFQFHPAFTSCAASGPMQAPTFASGATTATSASSTSSPFDVPSPLRWGSLQANGHNTSTPFSFLPAQDSGNTASAFPPSFAYPGGFARPDVGVSPTAPFGESHFSSPSGRTPKNPFGCFLHPGFGVRCPSNLFGPNSQTTTPVPPGRSPFLVGVGTEQGSRYPRYAPTPDLFDYSGGQGKLVMSISASNSHGHKSHEELRWEDYKNGDKGGVGWFPPAHKSHEESRWGDYKNGDKGGSGWFPPAHTYPFSSPTVSPSLFASPSIPDRPQMRTIDLTHHRPQMRTIDLTDQNMSGFPMGYNIPTAVQRPHEPAGVSSPASGCTACGATSSSSPSAHVGLNNTTNPPSSATSLPGLFLSTYGSCPLLFATPSLAAHGIVTTPAVQAYAMMFGTPNLAAQGATTTTPAVQAYPVMFVTAGQGTTTTPTAQPYPIMMFGTPNDVAQGSTTTPAAQPYPQGTTTTTPAAQPYPMMFGTPNIVTQGTTTTPAAQPYAMMFGTPNLGAQGITPVAQAYPVNGLNLLPFSALSLQ